MSFDQLAWRFLVLLSLWWIKEELSKIREETKRSNEMCSYIIKTLEEIPEYIKMRNQFIESSLQDKLKVVDSSLWSIHGQLNRLAAIMKGNQRKDGEDGSDDDLEPV